MGSRRYGRLHCWLAPPAQAQICACVPDPPQPVSSRHLPDCGFRYSPLDWCCQTCAPVPLHVYSCTSVPLAVPPPDTSRHLPSDCSWLAEVSVQDCALVPLHV